MHEENPMLGTRGVRLAALKPGLYEMQVRALLEAGLAEAAAGRPPRLEGMIPLTINGAGIRDIERVLFLSTNRILKTLLEAATLADDPAYPRRARPGNG